MAKKPPWKSQTFVLLMVTCVWAADCACSERAMDRYALSSTSPPLPNVNVLPISLRAGLTVQIAGLPFDLTKAEAQKIANIVLAHAVEYDL